MELEQILATLLMGLAAGWIASLLTKGRGGLLKSLVLGLIGSGLGNWLFNVLNLNIDVGGPFVNALIPAVAGAIIVIYLARMLSR